MRTWTLTERADGTVDVDHIDGDDVHPTINKPNRRAAVGRLLQLLDLGPVAPQREPERVCIGAAFEGDVAVDPAVLVGEAPAVAGAPETCRVWLDDETSCDEPIDVLTGRCAVHGFQRPSLRRKSEAPPAAAPEPAAAPVDPVVIAVALWDEAQAGRPKPAAAPADRCRERVHRKSSIDRCGWDEDCGADLPCPVHPSAGGAR